MPDLALLTQHLEDPALRGLARAIRTHAISREAAREQIETFRAATPFDSGDRLNLELLLDTIEDLPD